MSIKKGVEERESEKERNWKYCHSKIEKILYLEERVNEWQLMTVRETEWEIDLMMTEWERKLSKNDWKREC